LNKRVVWFFEVKSNDGIWRGAVGGENIAKLLHRADESKGVEIWSEVNVLVGRV
jgi:hypothetical protein